MIVYNVLGLVSIGWMGMREVQWTSRFDRREEAVCVWITSDDVPYCSGWNVYYITVTMTMTMTMMMQLSAIVCYMMCIGR